MMWACGGTFCAAKAPRKVTHYSTDMISITGINLVNPPEAGLLAGLYRTESALGRVDEGSQWGSLPGKLQGDLQVLERHPWQKGTCRPLAGGHELGGLRTSYYVLEHCQDVPRDRPPLHGASKFAMLDLVGVSDLSAKRTGQFGRIQPRELGYIQTMVNARKQILERPMPRGTRKVVHIVEDLAGRPPDSVPRGLRMEDEGMPLVV